MADLLGTGANISDQSSVAAAMGQVQSGDTVQVVLSLPVGVPGVLQSAIASAVQAGVSAVESNVSAWFSDPSHLNVQWTAS
jgi:hypothetical protein